MTIFGSIFASRTSKAARELSLEGHRQRKINEREHKLAVARRLCAEMGRPVPEALR